jgi:uncharacterized protein (DUF362 family)
LKPDNVVIDRQLAASDAKNLEGILEFLKSIGKDGNVVIAESPARGSVLEGFANYGYERMEGEGPASGTPVNSCVCVVRTDWLAAKSVAVELMGIDFAKIGCLNYCAQTGMGEADLSKIEIVGPTLKDYIKPYKLAKSIDQQLIWMKPVNNG